MICYNVSKNLLIKIRSIKKKKMLIKILVNPSRDRTRKCLRLRNDWND